MIPIPLPSRGPLPTAELWFQAARSTADPKSGPTTCSATPETSPSPSSRPRRIQDGGEGLQQAKDYAEILGLKFAYATNGHGIIEFDFLTGVERTITAFPAPAELWARLAAGRQGLDDRHAEPPAHALLPPARQTAPATTRRSPSTGRCRHPARASSASCSRWRPAPARPWWPSRSAGSCGSPAGTAPANTAAPRFSILPTATS